MAALTCINLRPAITAKSLARGDRLSAGRAGKFQALAAFDAKPLFGKIGLAAMATDVRRH